MATLIIDTAVDITAALPALKASGVQTVIGYMSSINPTGPKCLNPLRVKAIAARGIRVGLVHEGWGGVDGKGITAEDGVRDGAYCRAKAPLLGAPKGACVYFACDTDFSSAEITNLVLPYFRSIKAQFGDGFYRVGVYGSGKVCSTVMDYGLADLSWLAESKGWTSYSAWLAKASDVQGPQTKLDGVEIDSDTAHGDIGDFVPVFDGDAPKPAPAPVPVAANPSWFQRWFG
jgi:hypothetical protein